MKRILAYSSGAAVFLLVHADMDAQVVYENIDPDTIIDYDQSFALDFNDDGIDDILFEGAYSSWETFTSYFHSYYRSQIFYIKNFDAVVNNPIYPTSFGAKNLLSGDSIGTAASWNTEEEIKIARFYKEEHGWYSNNTALNSYYDNWVKDAQYLGVRFQIDGADHYGWVRLSVNSLSKSTYAIPQLIIQDYGYESIPGASVLIENPTASIATNLFLLDAGESGTANDLRLSFTKAEHEETVSAYRIFLYKYTYPVYPSPPTIDSLLSLPADRYTEIAPTGDDVEIYFNELTLDIQGNPILTGYGNYKAIVLSVPDDMITTLPNVSLESNAENIMIRDAYRAEYIGIDNPGNAGTMEDFEVGFEQAYYEYGILEYRAYIMNYFDEYSETELLALDTSFYAAIPPDGSESYTILFTSGNKIVSEITPSLFGKYATIVISVADGVMASDNASNDAYSYTTFFYTPYNEMPVVSIDGATGTPADCLVDFNKLKYEMYMDEYRLFLVPEEELDLFTPEMAFDAGTNEYKQVLPIGENIHEHLKPAMNDCFGNSIETMKTYRVVVAMIDNADRTALSLPSAPVSFSTGIEQNDATVQLFMFENILTIETSPGISSQLTVMNATGEIVLLQPVHAGSSHIDLSFLPQGFYLAELTGENLKQLIKISIF